jgi:hypothetical protein
MENNHKLGHYVSYYLSRFDEEAYHNLGYGNQVETHNKIEVKLSVNPYTVKNWRDEFDPLFGHWVGWYQRHMSPSRARVVQALEIVDEPQILEIVQDIIFGMIQNEEDELEQLLSIVTTDDNKTGPSKFLLRAPTGRQAEEYYLKYFADNKKPIYGSLIDCRDLGVGYDFRIENKNKNSFVEVKGLSEFSGGILFTSKVWTVSQNGGAKYFLCVISNLVDKHEIILIQDPGQKLTPKRNIFTSIQISWSVCQTQLSKINDLLFQLQ